MLVVTEQGKPERETGDPLRKLSDILLRQYLLRGLLWCQRCDEPWVPILPPSKARYYACSSEECPHPAMSAKLMEQRVWSRFVRLGGTTGCHVTRQRRHELLREELKRVVVGWWIGEVRLEWRE